MPEGDTEVLEERRNVKSEVGLVDLAASAASSVLVVLGRRGRLFAVAKLPCKRNCKRSRKYDSVRDGGTSKRSIVIGLPAERLDSKINFGKFSDIVLITLFDKESAVFFTRNNAENITAKFFK